ncbi:MAG: hypothetical protein A3G24_21715 [Betaproteobacteria bacterium RIFCSPLOWO2_12_FULL_62_13]|nr:MAG: hypothetical protein A3G24_21715 [Betaproteobacteria bacterium RIFCSPLOWO2_12_FULL_62_13]
MMHRICRTDPISLQDTSSNQGYPCLEEGDLTIYFESEENKQAYLGIPIERPEHEMRFSLDNPTHDMVDEG